MYKKHSGRWVYSDDHNRSHPPWEGDLLNYILNQSSSVFPRGRDSWVLRTIPQRTSPLADFELHDELIDGPIAVMMLKRKGNVIRVAVILLLYTCFVSPIVLAVGIQRSSELDLQFIFIYASRMFMLTFGVLSVVLGYFTLTLKSSEAQRKSENFLFSSLAVFALLLTFAFPSHATPLLIFGSLFYVLLFRPPRRPQSNGIYRATLQCVSILYRSLLR